MKVKKSDLQIYLGEKIITSDMSKSAKKQMLEFVQTEGSIHQLMYLATEGKIAKVDSDKKKALVERKFAESQYITEMSEEAQVLAGAAIGAAGGILIKHLLKLKSEWYRCLDRCKGMVGYTGSLKKRECYEKCRAQNTEAKILILKQGLAKCPQSKNPEKCEAKLKKAIEKQNMKLIKRKAML